MNIKNKDNSLISKKMILLGVVCLFLSGVIALGLYLNYSFASDDTSDVPDENHVELECKEYISFESKLTCKVSVTVASNQEISSVSLKLSDIPVEVENLLDSSYESTILSEGEYVDIVFGNDIVTNDTAIKLDTIKITFDNVTTDKLVTTSDAFFINSNYAVVEENIKVTNPSLASTIPVFNIEGNQDLMYGFNKIINDEYLYLGNGINSKLIADNVDMKALVEKQITTNGDVTAIGCTYEVSDDGTILTITDDYGNNKILKVIYVASYDSDYMIDWYSSLNLYTRGLTTVENISKNLIKTNGYMVLTDDEIQIYGDSTYTDLIDSRNWYYIKSSEYDFTSNIVNISEKVTYEDFMNNVEFHSVTASIYNADGIEITSGYLDKTNTLTISGIPGWDTENITINTEISDYIEISNINILENSENNYIIYDVAANTTIEDLLTNIDTSGIVKVYDVTGKLLSNYENFAYTNMYIEITLSDKTVHYDVSVLGDLVGKGTVYLSDVVKLYKIHRGKIEPTQAEMLAGDVVDDDNIDLLDVAKLYRYYRGVEESLK